MTSQRIIRKSLACEEDILFGKGSVIQSRDGSDYNLTKVSMPKVVDSLDGVDTDKFTTVIMNGEIYHWNGSEWVSSSAWPTVAALKEANLKVGQFVHTQGYYTPGDGGAASYLVAAPQAVDGYGDHELANGNVALLQVVTRVDTRSYGVVGDGVTDDSQALAAAMANHKTLSIFGATGNLIALASPIETSQQSIDWQGGADTQIVYTGAHAEYMLRINFDATGDAKMKSITFDGNKLCNKPLELLNNTTNDTATSLVVKDCFFVRAKRLNTFSGGDGLYIRGSFSSVAILGGGASDCELPAGQGSSGVIGISGISITWYSDTSYVKKALFGGVSIEKIYSSDLAYEYDQEGIKYFTPTGADGKKLLGHLVVNGNSSFKNCYGRSIKTQCKVTRVKDCIFSRDEGLASGQGNGEVNVQAGDGYVENCTFEYYNGQQPGVCVSTSSESTIDRASHIVRACNVYLDSLTTLKNFALFFPSTGFLAFQEVSGCSVYGKVEQFVSALCNGDQNSYRVCGNYADEIVAESETGSEALIYVRTSGPSSPFFANIIAENNVYTGANAVSLVRSGISGNSMRCNLSAANNEGFVDDPTAAINATLDNAPALNASRFTSTQKESNKGFFGCVTKAIVAGATEVFDVKTLEGTLILLAIARNQNSSAMFSAIGAATTEFFAGSEIAIGSNTNPGTGLFNVWASGTNQISVENTDASTRITTLFFVVSR